LHPHPATETQRHAWNEVPAVPEVASTPVDTGADDFIKIKQSTSGYALWTRALDVAVGALSLALATPIMLVLAVLIRLDSPGPIVFRQVRVGRGGRTFVFYKFRTMWMDARSRFPELYAYDYSEDEIRTMFFKVVHDPRLTRVGRHLRKTSLDELPNLVNVIRGEMTLVGPRPEIPQMLRYYTPSQRLKFAVKPGLTGLAQVNGRAVLRFQETIAADVDYVQRRSPQLDMWILWRTLVVVVKRVGAF
jgi:lipopolysaccharide/colanic/teichoic acid biosynthesis glycosyltransferase